MKRLFDILARMRRLSLTLLLIPSALYLSAEEPTHPFTINASGAQVLLEPGTTGYTWSEVAAQPEGFLSQAEWEYLFANHRWRFLTRDNGELVSNSGIVIYPNDFPEGNIVGDISGFPGEAITEVQWTALQNAGARFIYYKEILSGIQQGYWTTTAADADNGYYVTFHTAVSPTPGTVTCTATADKTAEKFFVRVTRLPAPSCDCFTVHF